GSAGREEVVSMGKEEEQKDEEEERLMGLMLEGLHADVAGGGGNDVRTRHPALLATAGVAAPTGGLSGGGDRSGSGCGGDGGGCEGGGEWWLESLAVRPRSGRGAMLTSLTLSPDGSSLLLLDTANRQLLHLDLNRHPNHPWTSTYPGRQRNGRLGSPCAIRVLPLAVEQSQLKRRPRQPKQDSHYHQQQQQQVQQQDSNEWEHKDGTGPKELGDRAACLPAVHGAGGGSARCSSSGGNSGSSGGGGGGASACVEGSSSYTVSSGGGCRENGGVDGAAAGGLRRLRRGWCCCLAVLGGGREVLVAGECGLLGWRFGD
ncbi:hypothetical protein Agub_g2561, partial [Astrephomene gubernaculifera]